MKIIQKIRSLTRRYAAVVVAMAGAGLLLQPTPASAFTCGAGLALTAAGTCAIDNSYASFSLNTSGTAADLSATLSVAHGGTNLTAATDDNVMVGNGTTWQSKALTTCPTGGISYDASTNTFGCTAVGSAINPTLIFTSETKIPSGSTTYYMGAGGRLSATEGDVIMPMGGHRLRNLRVYSSGTTGGSGIAVTVGTGVCTAGLTYTSTPTATVTSTTQVADTSTTVTPTAGQCLAIKLVPTSTTLATFINVSLEYDT